MNAAANGHVATDPVELHVSIVHASPGRLRLKLPRDEMQGEALNRAEHALQSAAGIEDVRPNPLASSVLVRYNPGSADLGSVMDALEQAGVNVVVENLQDVVQSTGGETPGTLGDAIGSIFSNADARVSRLMHGRADLRTLLPVGLGALAVREVFSGRAVAAPWYVLAWYAFDSFTRLRQAPKNTDAPSA